MRVATVAFAAVISVACGYRSELDDRVAAHTNDCGASLASGSDWTVYASETDSTPLGPARPVCVSPTTPSNCPAGAVLYGGIGSWSVDVSGIAGVWIWAPGVTPTAPSDLAKYVFKRTLKLSGTSHATLRIAADDYAQIVVNDVVVGVIGSITDHAAAVASNASFHPFDLGPFMHDGENTISIIAQNGPTAFGGGCAQSGCDYAHNPAFVIFDGQIACE